MTAYSGRRKLSSRYDDLYLVDIIEASVRLQKMVSGRNVESVETDELIASAIQFQLVIIGEACSALEGSTRDLMPEIPFTKIRGFRNRLVHGYFSIDPATIWNIATVEVPVLAKACERTLRDHFPDTSQRLNDRRSQG